MEFSTKSLYIISVISDLCCTNRTITEYSSYAYLTRLKLVFELLKVQRKTLTMNEVDFQNKNYLLVSNFTIFTETNLSFALETFFVHTLFNLNYSFLNFSFRAIRVQKKFICCNFEVQWFFILYQENNFEVRNNFQVQFSSEIIRFTKKILWLTAVTVLFTLKRRNDNVNIRAKHLSKGLLLWLLCAHKNQSILC